MHIYYGLSELTHSHAQDALGAIFKNDDGWHFSKAYILPPVTKDDEENIKIKLLQIDSKTLIIKDLQTGDTNVEAIDVAPYIKDGYSFLPFRTLGEKILGLSKDNITWDANTKLARFN